MVLAVVDLGGGAGDMEAKAGGVVVGEEAAVVREEGVVMGEEGVVVGVAAGVGERAPECAVSPRLHVVGFLVLLAAAVALEGLAAWVSMRGSIMNAAPRAPLTYLLYARLGQTNCTLLKTVRMDP